MPASTKPMRLVDETWGERVRRAYYQARTHFGEGFNYRTVAERIGTVYPVSAQALQRLERQADVPTQPRVRLVAYYALTAYGFDPEDFGLTMENTPLGNVDLRKTRQLIAPRNRPYSGDGAAHTPVRHRAA